MDRTKAIGGSDMAAILNISPWKDAFTLWREKVGEIEQKPQTEAMRNGLLKELYILEYAESKLSLENGSEACNGEFIYNVKIAHPKYEFLVGSLDGLCIDANGNKTVIEAKTSSLPYEEDRLPDYYVSQVAFYCELAQAKRAKVFTLFKDGTWDEHEYVANHDYQKHLINKAIEFWNLIQNKIPPLLLSLDEDGEVQKILDLKKKIKLLEEEVDKRQKALYEKYLTDGVIRTKDGWVKLVTQERESFDSKVLKENNKDVYEKFKKTTTFRALRNVK